MMIDRNRCRMSLEGQRGLAGPDQIGWLLWLPGGRGRFGRLS
jgi:hypothetical protein